MTRLSDYVSDQVDNGILLCRCWEWACLRQPSSRWCNVECSVNVRLTLTEVTVVTDGLPRTYGMCRVKH